MTTGLDSTGRGNTSGRCAEFQAFTGTVVEFHRDGIIEVGLAERGRVRSLGQILAQLPPPIVPPPSRSTRADGRADTAWGARDRSNARSCATVARQRARAPFRPTSLLIVGTARPTSAAIG